MASNALRWLFLTASLLPLVLGFTVQQTSRNIFLSSPSCLYSTSAPEQQVSSLADGSDDDDDDEFSLDDFDEDELDLLLESAGKKVEEAVDEETETEDLDEFEEDDLDLELLLETAGVTESEQPAVLVGEKEEVDEVELLAAIEETPVGELSRDQVYFLRDIMNSFVTEEHEEPYDPDESTAPIVDKLLFRLLEEWQAVVEEDAEDEVRTSVLQPTIADFTNALKAWQKDALHYSSSRRRDARGKESVEKTENLLEILQQLWSEAGIESLRPNQEVLEIVLSVMSTSRDQGMDRRVGALFESVEDYGLQPSCSMYQSYILSLARSKDRGSCKRAEAVLREAVDRFPPNIDPYTGLQTGINIESFNKVLVSWAKSGFEYGPERAEKLIVFMDDLDRESGEQGLTKPNLSSFTTLIDAYAQQRDWDGVIQSERIFNRVLDHYLEGILTEEPNLATWTIVMSAWSRLAKKNRRGAEVNAGKLLKRMESLHEDGRLSYTPDAIAYSACMNAWAFSKNPIGPTQAEILLDEMHEKYIDGDDSMKPSARSIQIVLDAWVKMGTEEAMEQAEIVLDTYENHLEELGNADNSESDVMADVYRSMLLGWSRCNPERAQEYLLDMQDRHMALDSFVFDKVIEGETHRIKDDPGAMKRIHEVFDILEKCSQAGEVNPNERVFTSYIRAITRAHEDQLAEKAFGILKRMNSLSQAGSKGIAPTLFTYNAIINACAESIHCEDSKPVEAFKIALGIFNMVRVSGLDHVTCGNMLKCGNLLPEGLQKEKFVVATFKLACDRGLVNALIIRDLQGVASEEMWRSMLRCPEGEVDMERLPPSWSATITAKNNKKQSYGDDRKPYERRRFS